MGDIVLFRIQETPSGFTETYFHLDLQFVNFGLELDGFLGVHGDHIVFFFTGFNIANDYEYFFFSFVAVSSSLLSLYIEMLG